MDGRAAWEGRVIHGDPDWSRFDGCRRVSVVGAPYHQRQLAEVGGRWITTRSRYECVAELVPEPDNAHDRFAVQVMVGGVRIGYLKKGAARRHNRRIRELREAGRDLGFTALIRRVPEDGSLQAHLQVPYDSELLEGWKNPKSR